MSQFVLGAPKIKFLIPKNLPPSFSLNEENIQPEINGEDVYKFEHEISNNVHSILDFYKEKNEEKIYSSKINKTCKQKDSNKSIETRCSEKDIINLD